MVSNLRAVVVPVQPPTVVEDAAQAADEVVAQDRSGRSHNHRYQNDNYTNHHPSLLTDSTPYQKASKLTIKPEGALVYEVNVLSLLSLIKF
jgi:hypothetical protein